MPPCAERWDPGNGATDTASSWAVIRTCFKRPGAPRVGDWGCLLDDLGGLCEHGLRDAQPEGMGGLQIDHEVKAGWLLDRVGPFTRAGPRRLWMDSAYRRSTLRRREGDALSRACPPYGEGVAMWKRILPSWTIDWDRLRDSAGPAPGLANATREFQRTYSPYTSRLPCNSICAPRSTRL